jgi:hypothetical protein
MHKIGLIQPQFAPAGVGIHLRCQDVAVAELPGQFVTPRLGISHEW